MFRKCYFQTLSLSILKTVVTKSSMCQCTGWGRSSTGCSASRFWHWWATNCIPALFHWNPYNCSLWFSLKQINLLHSWWFSSHLIPLMSWSGAGALCLPREVLLCTDCLMFQGSFAMMYSGFQWTIPKGIVGKYLQIPHSFEYLGFLLISLDISDFFYFVCLFFLQSHWKMQHNYLESLPLEHSARYKKSFLSYFFLMWWKIIGNIRR